MDVEHAFKVVGNFGRYQAFLYVCLAFSHTFTAWQMVQTVFVGAVPQWINITNASTHAPKPETIVTEWNLCDKTWVIQLIQSLFMFGVLVGSLIFGQLSDKYGRKPVFYSAFGMLIFTSFTTTFADNYQVLAAIRFFVGIFEGGTILVSYVLLQELLGSSVWTLSGSMSTMAFSVGIVSLAGIASICLQWRDFCWGTSLPGLLFWLSVFVVPESPRWLYSQGRLREAEDVLRYVAMKNGVSLLSCSSIVLKKSTDKISSNRNHYGFKNLFTNKVVRLRICVMSYLWFACSFVYYGLTFGAGELSQNLYLSIALSGLVELPASMICIAFLDRTWAGRRRTLSGNMLVGGVACLTIMLVHLNADGTSDFKLGLALVGKLAVSCSFTTVYIYASELFPTVVRNVAMGTVSMCARFGGILAPFAASLAAYASSLPFVLFGIVGVIASLLTLLLPETLHQSVPDDLDDIVELNRVLLTEKEDEEQLISS